VLVVVEGGLEGFEMSSTPIHLQKMVNSKPYHNIIKPLLPYIRSERKKRG